MPRDLSLCRACSDTVTSTVNSTHTGHTHASIYTARIPELCFPGARVLAESQPWRRKWVIENGVLSSLHESFILNDVFTRYTRGLLSISDSLEFYIENDARNSFDKNRSQTALLLFLLILCTRGVTLSHLKLQSL